MPKLFYARIIAPAYDRPRPHSRSLVLHPAFQPLPQKGEEADGRTDGRMLLASLSVYFASPIRILVALLSLLLLLDTLLHLLRLLRISDMKTVDVPRNDWRPSKKCTRTLHQTFSVSLTPALCPRISPGKVFQTLKMHDIPTALRGEAHRIDIHAYRACSIRICVCMYVTSRRWVGERWEFLYERRTDKSNKEQRRTIVVAIF